MEPDAGRAGDGRKWGCKLQAVLEPKGKGPGAWGVRGAVAWPDVGELGWGVPKTLRHVPHDGIFSNA
jgi:hypothetical protein